MKIMTASQAKQLAIFKIKPEYLLFFKNKIDSIDELIEIAANRGRFSITYNDYLSEDIVFDLKKRGFIVKSYNNLMASENSNYTEISW